MYIDKLFNLNRKIAAVIGAGGHLCSEMARSFARAGCKVVIIDLRLEKAQKVEREINDEGFKDTLSLALDVAKKEQHHHVLEAIIMEWNNGFPNKRNLFRLPSLW